jgi:hypothetical protein
VKDKEIFPAGLVAGAKTKTNYNLVGLVFAGLIVAFIASCIWLPSPLKEILAVPFVAAIICSPLWIPRMMKQMPPSEHYKYQMAELGYYEKDGKTIPLERLHPTTIRNPAQLPQASLKAKEDGTKG